MSADPAFASAINTGVALLGSAETNLQVPVNASVILTAGTSGTKVEEVVVEASATTLGNATTVAGLVYLFIYDGTTYHLYDSMLITTQTSNSTGPPFRQSRTYPNLLLKSGQSLRASQSIAGNASLLKVHAFGGDL